MRSARLSRPRERLLLAAQPQPSSLVPTTAASLLVLPAARHAWVSWVPAAARRHVSAHRRWSVHVSGRRRSAAPLQYERRVRMREKAWARAHVERTSSAALQPAPVHPQVGYVEQRVAHLAAPSLSGAPSYCTWTASGRDGQGGCRAWCGGRGALRRARWSSPERRANSLFRDTTNAFFIQPTS